MKKIFFITVFLFFIACSSNKKPIIDREKLILRNNPQITSWDILSSLSVGNGEFAFTTDFTGLQTFHEQCSQGVPLGTQSNWGWHYFINDKNFRHDETLESFDFGRGKQELYSIQFKEKGRRQDAANWFRNNPHRLHLGIIGFELPAIIPEEVEEINQTLNMWEGIIDSKFKVGNISNEVKTLCHPHLDMIAVKIKFNGDKTAIKFHFPYPTGLHSDDACDWDSDAKHSTILIEKTDNRTVLKREIDETFYYLEIKWEHEAEIIEKSKNYWILKPKSNELNLICSFSSQLESNSYSTFNQVQNETVDYWNQFWLKGAAVDFSMCTDNRAKELERRVVLSQYLLAIQCSGSVPPQETGLTYNSWYGKFHLEMIWWHQAHFALWNRSETLLKTLQWYKIAGPNAKNIAQRQGFEGVRWMKMTDPNAIEAPSDVGSFLIWQQPHIIYLAELVYRENSDFRVLEEYYNIIQETAKFMYSFATYDAENDRFILKGVIPAQETLKPSETVNPPFELSYWRFAMELAQKWRERMGEERNIDWDNMIEKLSRLAYNDDNIYLAAESATDTYQNIRFTSDHMAVLGTYGILPENNLFRKDYMLKTLDWIIKNWNWDKTWGWDYSMTAMNAVRLGEPEMAINILLMENRTNTYLINGHNYQDDRLRVYLPGNGGLLTAIALMCAGWDGCNEINPGFPKNGKWNVNWESLKKMP